MTQANEQSRRVSTLLKGLIRRRYKFFFFSVPFVRCLFFLFTTPSIATNMTR